MSYQTKEISKFLFQVQISINTFIMFGAGLQQHNVEYFLLAILNLLALFIYDSSNRKKLIKINRFFQIIFQSLIIPVSISLLIQSTSYNWNSWLIWIIIIYGIIMFIPYTIILIGPIKTTIMRLIVTIYMFVFNGLSSLDTMTMDTYVANNRIVKILSDSSFLGAIIFAVIIIIAMSEWGYGFPKVKLSKYINLKVLIAIGIFSIWFTIWNAFNSGNTLLGSIVSFNFNAHFTASNFLSGLEAGIAEELTFRFAILTILLVLFKNYRFQIFYASLLSGLLFGLIHLPNATGGQSLSNTFLQVIFAIAIGIYFASVYLYTDCIAIPIFIHSLMDILVFAASGSQIMTGKVASGDYLFTIIEAFVFIIIGFILLMATYNRNKFRLYF